MRIDRLFVAMEVLFIALFVVCIVMVPRELRPSQTYTCGLYYTRDGQPAVRIETTDPNPRVVWMDSSGRLPGMVMERQGRK